MNLKKLINISLVCAFTAFLSSCSDLAKILHLNNKGGSSMSNFKSSAPYVYNDTAAITIDVVAIMNDDLVKKIKKMKSDEYFAYVESLTTLHPQDIHVWRFEQMQLSNIERHELIWPIRTCKALEVVVFVDYRNGLDNKIVVPNSVAGLELVLGRNSIDTVRFIKTHLAGKPKKPTLQPKATNLELLKKKG